MLYHVDYITTFQMIHWTNAPLIGQSDENQQLFWWIINERTINIPDLAIEKGWNQNRTKIVQNHPEILKKNTIAYQKIHRIFLKNRQNRTKSEHNITTFSQKIQQINFVDFLGRFCNILGWFCNILVRFWFHPLKNSILLRKTTRKCANANGMCKLTKNAHRCKDRCRDDCRKCDPSHGYIRLAGVVCPVRCGHVPCSGKMNWLLNCSRIQMAKSGSTYAMC